MATYAIGDIHGCLEELEDLLSLVNFDKSKDKLWLVGDLVNRGKNSLGVLRFIYNLGDNAIVVLGNHDLYLLYLFSLQNNKELLDKFPKFEPISQAKDRNELLHWLRKRPLLHYDQSLNYVMTHAGLPPQWGIDEAILYSKEVEQALHGEKHIDFLHHIEGNKPDKWEDSLVGYDRLRCIVNYLTRMRFCDINGHLNLSCKAQLGSQPQNYMPWFKVPWRKNKNVKIIFGHWAALSGITDEPSIFALDTGCVWGKTLTAMRLEDGVFFSVKKN